MKWKKLLKPTKNGVAKFRFTLNQDSLKYNPFAHIEKLKTDRLKRQAFTNKEIELIEENIDSFPFCKHLYNLGVGTGMRMGNMCLLKWSDIDMDKRIIHCENLKTKGSLTIPILPELYRYLKECKSQKEGYVSEEHASRYKNNSPGVSTEFSKFLNGIGIKTSIEVENRARKGSVKGVHALRHTFIYRAMLAGVPINVIQCIVGHVDEDITKMYADHVLIADAQKAMAGFSISEKVDPRQDLITTIMNKLTDKSPEQLEKVAKMIDLI